MIAHFLQVAIRSLIAYKSQTLISVIGLAVGFVCFVFSALWLRYEKSYDTFHDGADRIYMIKTHSLQNTISVKNIKFLKDNFPEIEEGCTSLKIEYEDDSKRKINALLVDKNFFRLFPLAFKQGSEEQFFASPRHALINEESTERLYPDQNPLGTQVTINQRKILSLYPDWNKIPGYDSTGYILTNVSKSWKGHSDFCFDYMFPLLDNEDAYVTGFIKLHKGVDPDELTKKIKENEQIGGFIDSLFPLLSIHTSDKIGYAPPSNLTASQLTLFTLAGVITVLCFVFNYISLFVSKIQKQSQGWALRRALGSSFKQLYLLLATEIVLLLLVASLISCILIEWLMPLFIEFAHIQNDSSGFWLDILLYMGGITLLSLFLISIPLTRIRATSLSFSLKGNPSTLEGRRLQNGLLCFQLIIGILLLFCTTVFIIQIRYINQVDLGYDRSRLCFVEIKRAAQNYKFHRTRYDFSADIQQVKQYPEVEDIIGYYEGGRIAGRCGAVIFKSPENEDHRFLWRLGWVNADYFNFCGISCIQGQLFNDSIPDQNIYKLILNQTAAKQFFSSQNPIGKKIDVMDGIVVTVIGVVNDVYDAVTRQPEAKAYLCSESLNWHLGYRHRAGMRQAAEEKIRTLFAEHNPVDELEFFYMEDLVNQQNKTEINFLKLLYLLSAVCIGGALFGIYAMVSLACQRRRKEIAIRKINGATIGVLIRLFLKRYLWLLTAASLVAFPVGYLLMSLWMEQFVLRATLPLWVYPLLFLIVAWLLSGVVVLRIWHSVHINPAEEIRKE